MGKYINTYDDDDEAWEAEQKIYEEEWAYWNEHIFDTEPYSILDETALMGMTHMIFYIEKLDGNYIEEYDRKLRSGGIEVNDEYREHAERTEKLVKGFDARTGIYGSKVAASGFYSAGCEYFEKKEFQKAIDNFSKACEINPRMFVCWANKARCHLELAETMTGREQRWQFWYAIIALWAATQLNPTHMALLSDENRAFYEKIELKAREEFFEPLFIEHTYLRGVAYARRDDHNEAVDEFNYVIKRDPDNLMAWHARLASYMFFEDDENILVNAQKLLDSNYQTLYAIQCRGIAYERLEKYDEAISDFDKALSLDPSLGYIWTRRAFCYHKKGDFKKAVEDTTEAIRRGNNTAYSYRGYAYIGLKEYEKAVADYDIWLKEDPDDEWARKNRQEALDALNGKNT